jgi:hypothetical protein
MGLSAFFIFHRQQPAHFKTSCPHDGNKTRKVQAQESTDKEQCHFCKEEKSTEQEERSSFWWCTKPKLMGMVQS